VNPQQLPPAQAAMFPGGDSQVQGVQSGILINQQGQSWRHFRMQQLLPIGGYLLAGAMLAVLLFYLIRGKVLIRDGESDKKIERYSVYERMIHWFMAFIFLFLGISGLILLFGRSLLLPWMGPELFSILASAAKEGHNLFGPLFLLALVLMFLKFAIRNIYQRGDLTWLLKGGGIIGEHDVPSNFFNMGEKTLFWMLIIVGGLIAISGLVLLFPVFGQGRGVMELSHAAHAIAAIVMLTVITGHIYIGTIGMQGAIEGMTSGYCDLNWAKDHHSWWAQRCIDEGKVLPKQLGVDADGGNPDSVSREAEK
jgi:formate dehydrogenase subunit gamma